MSIFARVLSFIQDPQPEAFRPLALEVFRYQFANVPAYHAYIESRAIDPAAVERIDQIPAVSTLAFKYARMETAAELPSPAARIFLTSGTTVGRDERGRHLVIYPEIYRASAVSHLRRMLFADGRRLAMLATHPTAERMAESSLSQMITWCIEEFGTGRSCCVATRDGIDVPSALTFLRECEARSQPVCMIGTTAASAALFGAIAQAGQPLALAAGSRMMDTGGAKGQALPLSTAEVIDRAGSLLGLDPALVINEYGMTELCSQLYDATSFNSDRTDPMAARVKFPPPWLKPFALDPVTLRPLPEGAPGMLAFFDLANVGSVSMLMTEDLGVVHDGAVTIRGRALGAGARGCALAIEQFAARERIA